MKIRAKHTKLAMASDCLDANLLSNGVRAQDVREHCMREVKALGLKIKEKNSTKLRLSKMSTTYYREIRVGAGFSEKGAPAQALILAHELVHARQWRKHGRVRFAMKYLASPRFRLAVELQAYRETVRLMRAFGQNPTYIEKYTSRLPFRLKDAYKLARVNWDHLLGLIQCVLREPLALT